jgi:FdhE protein
MKSLDHLIKEAHPLGSVIQVFRKLLVERARFKDELRNYAFAPIETTDSSRFERGVPLAVIEDLIDAIDEELWVTGTGRLAPVMAESFPRISKEIEAIAKDLLSGGMDPRRVLKASLAGRSDENATEASRLKVTPQSLSFALGQVAKPLIEILSETLRPLTEGLSWGKGYCPICGTMPGMAFLQGEGGQRWLRCASCAHEWRFVRLVCPFCESGNYEDLEIYYVAGREYESVHVCHKCKRYVLTIDSRNLPEPIAMEVAPLALMHLDVIAQEKGLLPVAVSEWNIVRDREIFSSPVHP